MRRRVLVLGDPAREATRRAIRASLPALRRLGPVRVATSGRRPFKEGEADLAVVFGGDGAVLHAAKRLAPAGIPLVGVNLGKLGFLTEVDRREVPRLVRRVAAGRYSVVSALMLACEVHRGRRTVLRGTALNDAVLASEGISRMVSLDLRVDARAVVTFHGDGLIVATPSGSTAHSLSAGGPILAPGVAAFAVTPLAPHTLAHRPLVLPPGCRIELRIPQGRGPTYLSLDGESPTRLKAGDRVRLARSPNPCRFLLLRRNAYFSTLRSKLHWGR